MGYSSKGKRDGTGPHKDSYQRSRGDKGKRGGPFLDKLRGRKK